MTYWKDLKRRCLAAGGLEKVNILEGIGRRATPKAGDLKKGSQMSFRAASASSEFEE